MLKGVWRGAIFIVLSINILFAAEDSFKPTAAHFYINPATGLIWLAQLNISAVPYKNIFIQTGGSSILFLNDLYVIGGYQAPLNDNAFFRIGGGYQIIWDLWETVTMGNFALLYTSFNFFPLPWRKIGFSLSAEMGFIPIHEYDSFHKTWDNHLQMFPSANAGVIFAIF